MSSNSLTDLERSEIEDLKEDLINSVSLEYSSLPSSPTGGSNSRVSRTAPPSPVKFRDSLSRHRSVSYLISDFENRHLDYFRESRVAQTVEMAEIVEIKSGCKTLKG